MEVFAPSINRFAEKKPFVQPYPEGWFCVGLSEQFKPRVVYNKYYFGQDLVIFRNQQGELGVIDPVCPHLGAHLGKLGTVQGNSIVCPFHGFGFDIKGQCTHTGYHNSNPPVSAKLYSWPVVEKNGLVMVYYSSQRQPPQWQLPDEDMTHASQLYSHEWPIGVHPQDVAENSVDLGHFTHTHKYINVQVNQPAQVEGHILKAAYTKTRVITILGLGDVSPTTEFTLEVHGIGYSRVNLHVREFNLHARTYVLPTPVSDTESCLRIVNVFDNRLDLGEINPLLKLLPRKLALALFQRIIHFAYRTDLEQDIRIWENKQYLENPAVAKGDGPIHLYRKYARQFYPQTTPRQAQQQIPHVQLSSVV